MFSSDDIVVTLRWRRTTISTGAERSAVRVRDLMTTDAVTIDAGRSLRTCAARMVEAGVGSVVVVDDGDPAGIVTETDALRAAAESNRPLGVIPVRAATQRPLTHVHPNVSVRGAAERMRTEGIKKLPVVDGLELVGILTLTDLVRHLPEIREEAADHVRAHARWQDDA